MATQTKSATATVELPPEPRSWYSINRAAESREAEILIYDEIGAYGITAKQFVNDLRRIGDVDTICVRMNSPGGDVIEGTAIFNALRGHSANIIVKIEGMALSAGSFIAMAGDDVQMADNAYMMIHNAWGLAIGDANDMRANAVVLDKMNENIAGMYEQKAGKDRDHWRGLMTAETWFTADEAKDEGLVDGVYEPAMKMAAMARHAPKLLSAYNKVPEPVRAMLDTAQQGSQAPEAPQRSEAAPVVHTQETPQMSTEATEAPAQNSAAAATVEVLQSHPDPLRAQEIQGYVNQGREAGYKAGCDDERERCKAIVAACPGKPGMALEYYLKGQTPDATRNTFEAVAAAENAANERFAKLEEQKRREVALAANGGFANGVPMDMETSREDREPMSKEEARDAASKEWDRNPKSRSGFSKKENFVNHRVAVLMGQFRGYSNGNSNA